MGIFNSKYRHKEMPETAAIRDKVGIWPVDIGDAFTLYRKGVYQYFGPQHINGEVCHIFYMDDHDCE